MHHSCTLNLGQSFHRPLRDLFFYPGLDEQLQVLDWDRRPYMFLTGRGGAVGSHPKMQKDSKKEPIAVRGWGKSLHSLWECWCESQSSPQFDLHTHCISAYLLHTYTLAAYLLHI